VQYCLYTHDDRDDLSIPAIQDEELVPLFLAGAQRRTGSDSESPSSRGDAVRLLRAEPIGLVLSTAGHDRAAVEDARLGAHAEVLGVPFAGQPLRVTELALDKVITRRVLQDAGLAVADGRVIDSRAALEQFTRRHHAVICKPIDGISGRGQFIASTGTDVPAIAQPMLAEEFLDGIEVSVDVFSHRGRHLVMPPIYKGPTSRTALHARQKLRVCPISWDDQLSTTSVQTAQQVAGAVGSDGWLNIDLVVRDSRAIVLEVNARYSGTTRLSAWSTGVNPYRTAIRAALGRPIARGVVEAVSTVVEVPLRRRVGSVDERDVSVAYSSNTGRFIGSATIKLDEHRRVPDAARTVVSAGGSSDFLAELHELV
jgi:D-alanine-D-alanine ligase-like ATP-grasp enzyme